MFAHIIPSLRTPRGINAFDYEIPKGMTVRPGDIVRIPFRSSTAIGIVDSLRKTIDHAGSIKPIVEPYANLRLSPKTLRLMHALAEHSFSSLPAITHAWLGALPKHPKKIPDISAASQMSIPESFSQTSSETNLLSNYLYCQNGLIETAKEKMQHGTSVLILTPWTERARHIASILGLPVLTGNVSPGKRFTAWKNFLLRQTPGLVATRVGAWLGCEADCILLDEPENDDHKQDELSPRYDTRWIVEQSSQEGIEVIRFGLTPRLQDAYSETNGNHASLRIPDIHADIEWVDIHRRDWSDVGGLQNRSLIAIEEAQTASQKIHIIHPIHGERAGLKCADCHWQARCDRCGAIPTFSSARLHCHRCGFTQPAPVICPSCQGTDLSFTRPGRDRLAQDIEKHGIHGAHIFSIGAWQEQTDLVPHSIVLLTDISLFSGGCEDIRRRERLIIAWRRLADSCAVKNIKLVVQGDPDLLMQARDWLHGISCEEALQKESMERKKFGYPPAFQLVKIIFRGSQELATECLDEMRALRNSIPLPNDEKTAISINGPFEVKFRPTHRGERFIGHVVTSKKVSILATNPILEPAKRSNAIIDLDPIAFFE